MLSNGAKERAGFPSSLASRAPRSKADFSTLKGVFSKPSGEMKVSDLIMVLIFYQKYASFEFFKFKLGKI